MLRYKLHDLKCEIKWAFQRMFRGYDDRAVWNMDLWFLEYAPKILKQLKEEHYGYPSGLTEEKWVNILDKMIECFTEANEETCSQKNEYADDYLDNLKLVDLEDGSSTIVNENSKLRRKYNLREDEIYDYRDKKLHEGLDLFSKYFWNLWD